MCKTPGNPFLKCPLSLADQTGTIDIRCGRLFPLPFFVLGGAVFLAGVGSIMHLPWIAVVLILLGAMVLTAYEGTEIRPHEKTLREYNSFLFLIRSGKNVHYDSIEKIYINSAKVSQKIYTAHTLNSSTFTNVEYNAWLKLGDGSKIFLASDRKKARLLKRFEAIAKDLNIALTDTTRQHHSS